MAITPQAWSPDRDNSAGYERASYGRIHAIGRKTEQLVPRNARMMLSEDLPPVALLENVLYLPPHDCLYDADGMLIEASCSDFTERRDMLGIWSKPPRSIDPAAAAFKTFDQPVIFAGSLTPAWGHFLTDDIQRLWYYLMTKDTARLLFTRPPDRASGWAAQLLELGGIAQSDIVARNRPLRLRHAILPYPSFQAFSKVYRCHERFFRNVVAAVGEPVPTPPAPDIYVSRRLLSDRNRKILNEDDVERRLEQAGYRVIFPERMSIREQVAAFAGAKRIVGCLGSAMHSTLFGFGDPRVGVMCLAAANLRCFLIDRLMGYESFYFSTNQRDYSLKPKRSVARSLFDERVDLTLMERYLGDTGFL